MHFARPYFLFLLLLIPFWILFFIIVLKHKRRTLSSFIPAPLWERVIPCYSAKKDGIRAVLFTGLFFLFSFALAGPQIGMKMVKSEQKGLDIFIALDTSKSMLAEDIKPNRLKKAQEELSLLINRMEGDRVGIIAFAGLAFLQCPLTTDYDAAKMFLKQVNTDLIPEPGTDLGTAIIEALDNFPSEEKKYKVLILLTDGEDMEGVALKAAEEARRQGVRIFIIGLGSREGARIPVFNSEGLFVDFKKNRKGEIVVTKLDEILLKKIAMVTGGRYYRSTTGGLEVDMIYKDMSHMERKDIKSGMERQYIDRYQYVLFLGLLVFIGGRILSERRGRVIG